VADLGQVAVAFIIPEPAFYPGPPLWWDPLASPTPVAFQYADGPLPGPAAWLNGRVPALWVNVIVADFGNVGGGIWTF